MKEALLQWNIWWREAEWREKWIEREHYVQESMMFLGKKIVVLYGVRRAGKTFIMFQIIRKLLERGEDPKRIVYINLDDERYPREKSALDEILNTYYELTGIGENFYLFIDEIQRLSEWGGYLRRFTDLRRDVKVIISGSSAGLLEPEIASKLSGRRIDIQVWPFSFTEFLKTKKIIVKDDPYLQFGGEQGIILHYLNEYMQYGGFPEVVLEESIIGKLRYLHSYFSDILHRDIAERHNVNIRKLKDLAKYLLENIGNQVRPSKLANYLDLSKPTIYDYLSYLEEAFLIFLVEPFGYGKEKIVGLKKIYSVDTGLRNAISRTSKDTGRQAENLVFLHLKKFTDEIYYYRKNDIEIDFLANINKELYAIESKWDIEEKEEKIRKIGNLAKKLGAKLLIVTKNEIGDGKIPLWLFLLTKPNDWKKYTK